MRKAITFAMALTVMTCMWGQRIFRVEEFGAMGDGVRLNTGSLQGAIDSAGAWYARTGQRATVAVPAGRFVTGTLYLKSGVALHLDEGATLLGSLNPFDYVKDPYCGWTALLFAVKQHDIAITGGGAIDGRGWEVANQMVEYIHMGLVKDPLKYDRPNEGNRPENIHFRECVNVAVSGIALRNPGSWNQQYDQCRGLLIENQTVDSKCYWNNDGMDIVDCSDVTIRNCNVDAADDAFCFKSHSPDGICQNVVMENCTGRSSANGIKFGTATRGKFRHFRFSNITIRDTYRSAITIASVDGATVEDVVVDNLRAVHTGNPVFLRIGERMVGKDAPCLKNITLRNVYVEVPLDKPDAGYSYEGPVEDLPRNVSPSSIVGTPNYRIQNVLLENVRIVYPGGADSTYAYRGCSPGELASIPEWEKRYPEFSMWKELPAWGFYLRHADKITFRNVLLQVGGVDYRPAIVADDVNGLVLDDIELRSELGRLRIPQVVANNCAQVENDSKGVRVQHQRAESKEDATPLPTSLGIVWAQDNSSPYTEGATLYKASMFGCKSNGTTLNTNSIQKAVDYIWERGGGTLVFEVGRYLTGSVRLREGVNIQLNEGAVWVGSSNRYDYDKGAGGRPALLIAPEEGSMQFCGLGRIVFDNKFLKWDREDGVRVQRTMYSGQ